MQALIYNAHLDGVHEMLARRSSTNGKVKSRLEEDGDIGEIPYELLTGPVDEQKKGVTSRAEQDDLQRQVSD